jgi:thioredoxin-dependent peroxiredoxin
MSISVGDPAPDVRLVCPDGTFPLTDLRGHWVVLYFYPKDDTPGCTAEACSFRDAFEDFTDAGAEVIGVSGDSAESHAAFSAKHRLPFRLVSDEDGALRRAFGVGRSMGILPGRVTYVIDPEGVVREVFNSQLRARQHHQRALDAIRAG